MTIASPNDGTIRHSDAIQTRSSHTQQTEIDWSNWERWMAGHKSAVYQDIACEMIDPLEQRLRALELELAETRGALDVLRDKRASSTDNVNETIDEIRTDFQEKVKEIELRLAETIGTVDVLRGKGVPGCFHVKGTFDAKAVYNYLDVVAFNGASWVATRDCPGSCPGNGWQLLAAQGSRGVRGERGPAGPAGIPPTFTGARFSHRGMEIETSIGPISLFKSVNVDPQNFTIKFIANDGSALTISLLPLFEAYHRQTKAP